jgi:hypothetical protein
MIMNLSEAYIFTAIAALAVIAILMIWIKPAGKPRNISPLASLAFAFIIAGILFGEEHWLGYELMGIGVLLAIIDIAIKYRARQ